MDKFEFTEQGEKYSVSKEGCRYSVRWRGGVASYQIDNDPTNWINIMIKKHFAKLQANGVDAKGNPYDLSQSDLKPFMRVKTKCCGMYLIAGEECSYTMHHDGGWLPVKDADGDWEIVAVYGPPENYLMLNVDKVGKLIWKRTPPKTAEQLAQEKAVAERKTAIEEAEKALKQAQEALDKLKGSV